MGHDDDEGMEWKRTCRHNLARSTVAYGRECGGDARSLGLPWWIFKSVCYSDMRRLFQMFEIMEVQKDATEMGWNDAQEQGSGWLLMTISAQHGHDVSLGVGAQPQLSQERCPEYGLGPAV